MSTKIYNAFKLPAMSLEGLNAWCMSFSEKVAAFTRKYTIEETVQTCEFVIDRIMSGCDDGVYDAWKGCIIMEAMGGIQEECMKAEATSRRTLGVDVEFKVAFIPAGDCILAICYAQHRPYIELFAKQPGVKDYHYQNSGDKPKSISTREWNKRRDKWMDLLDEGDGRADQLGFLRVFSDHMLAPFLMPDELQKHMHLRARRARYVALDTLCRRRFGIEKMTNPKLKVGAFVFRFFSGSGYIHTDDGKKEIADEIKRITPLLPERITKAHLLATVSDLKKMRETR